MCQIMTGNEKHTDYIRACLKNTIERVKSDRCPWSKGMRLIVFVMKHMNIFIKDLVGV